MPTSKASAVQIQWRAVSSCRYTRHPYAGNPFAEHRQLLPILSTVRDYPKYDPVTHILVVKIDHEDTSITSVTRYRIATNGSVEMIH